MRRSIVGEWLATGVTQDRRSGVARWCRVLWSEVVGLATDGSPTHPFVNAPLQGEPAAGAGGSRSSGVQALARCEHPARLHQYSLAIVPNTNVAPISRSGRKLILAGGSPGQRRSSVLGYMRASRFGEFNPAGTDAAAGVFWTGVPYCTN